MNKQRTIKLILLLAGLALVAGIARHFFRPEQRPDAAGQPGAKPSTAPPPQRFVPRPPPRPQQIAALPELAPPPGLNSNVQQMLLGKAGPPKIPREAIEKYLEQSKRSAAGLLAAFAASTDPACLKEAAASFPDDPRVQLAVLMHNAFPEERRPWLDRFKASAPDNSLASYLSAQEYFRGGQYEAGLQELLAASRRTRFEPYAFEGMLDVQELLLVAGKSPVEAKVSSMLGAEFPHLAQMKQLASVMAAMQSQYGAAGDAASFDAMTALGLAQARRLNGPAGGRCLIDQLVGIAIESQFLVSLDPASTPEFLGQPVQARLDELARQKAEVKKLAPLTSAYLPRASEAELITFFDRLKLQGEMEALRWLQARRGKQ